jgi:predicted transport protein
MDFPDIKDPQNLCKDVTKLGVWGNGNVQVKLSSMEQLDYIMYLIQQAFDEQMGYM